MRPLRPLFLLLFLGVPIGVGTACRHDCAVGHPHVAFSVASCCGSQSQWYWDNSARDCVELKSMGSLNCGCVCSGKDCDRLYWSREECRKEYGHCR